MILRMNKIPYFSMVNDDFSTLILEIEIEETLVDWPDWPTMFSTPGWEDYAVHRFSGTKAIERGGDTVATSHGHCCRVMHIEIIIDTCIHYAHHKYIWLVVWNIFLFSHILGC